MVDDSKLMKLLKASHKKSAEGEVASSQVQDTLKKVQKSQEIRNAPEKVYDAGQMKKEFIAKDRKLARSDRFKKALAKLGRIGGKLGALGSVASLADVAMNPAQAADYIADPLGPEQDSLEARLEAGEQLTEEELRKLYGK